MCRRKWVPGRLYSLDTETGQGQDLGTIRGTSTLTALAVEKE